MDRLDQVALPLNGEYSYKQTGKGVTVFVVDSGIRLTHEEFEGRATCGYDAVIGKDYQDSAIPCDDTFGHGTHVAGGIGGKTVGVAKDVDLVAVKVGTRYHIDAGAVIAGLDYIQKQKLGNLDQPMVASISIGGGYLKTINDAATALVKSGVMLAASAGNYGIDACRMSPASAEGVFVVGAALRNDNVAGWSNYGKCVSIYAPGDGIASAWVDNDTAFLELDGTSFAAPLAAGVGALYLEKDPGMSPNNLMQAIVSDSLKGVLTGVQEPQITNRLLHTGALLTDSASFESLAHSVCENFAVHARTIVSFDGVPSTIQGGGVSAALGTAALGTYITGAYTFDDREVGDDSAVFADSVTAAHAAAMEVRADGKAMEIEIGGKTFYPGTYRSDSAINFAYGTVVTLDGRNETDPVFLFQAGSTLVTAANTIFNLKNGAKAKNVLWALGTAATLGASSVVEGSILAGTAITFGTKSQLHGCALAQSAVTFESEGSIELTHYEAGNAGADGSTRHLRG